MKRKKIITALAICLITFGSAAAHARLQGGEGYGPQAGSETEYGEDGWRGRHQQNRHEMVGDLLGLSEEQEQQIEAIRAEEWDADKDMRERLWDYRDQMRELTDSGSFDEKAIRTLAEEQAKIQVELAVSKAKMHSRIHAIMTPEQQELAAKLRATRKDRRGPRRAPGGERF